MNRINVCEIEIHILYIVFESWDFQHLAIPYVTVRCDDGMVFLYKEIACEKNFQENVM